MSETLQDILWPRCPENVLEYLEEISQCSFTCLSEDEIWSKMKKEHPEYHKDYRLVLPHIGSTPNPKWYNKTIALGKKEIEQFIKGRPIVFIDIPNDTNDIINKKIEKTLSEKKYNKGRLDYCIKFGIPMEKMYFGMVTMGIYSVNDIDTDRCSIVAVNPYRNPIDTFLNIFHELCHAFQKNNEEVYNLEKPFLDKFKIAGKDSSLYEEAQQTYKEFLFTIESHANLSGAIITYLKTLKICKLDLAQKEIIKRRILLASGADVLGGYCDFILTKNELEKIDKNPSFYEQFFDKDGVIDIEKVYRYSWEMVMEQTRELQDYLNKNKLTFTQILKNTELMKASPIQKIIDAKEKYFLENPKTEEENLLGEIYFFIRKKEDRKSLDDLTKKTRELIAKQNAELAEAEKDKHQHETAELQEKLQELNKNFFDMIPTTSCRTLDLL